MAIKTAPKVVATTFDGVRILEPATKPTHKPKRPAAKIMEGLQEALAVAKGEAEPHAWHKRQRQKLPTHEDVRGIFLVRQPKKQLTLRLDVDVIEKFKATGPGWQARMNDVLKAVKL